MYEVPVTKKHKPPAAKYWRKIGESIDTDEKKNGERMTLQIAISHDGQRVAIGSFVYHTSRSTTVKVCDFDGIRWKEVGSFSGPGFDVDPFGRNLALSGYGKRLAIGNGNGAKQCVEVYRAHDDHEGVHWNDLWILWDGWDDLSLSADGCRAAVRFDSRNGIKVFECDLYINRWAVRAITGEADWGRLILKFLGSSWNQIGQDPYTEMQASDLSLSADGSTIAAVTCKGKECVKVFRYFNNSNWAQIGQNLTLCSRHDLGKKIGQSLSINATGNILAIGTAATFGCVETFQFINNEWMPMGKAIQNKSIPYFGRSICIAPNANRIAVGDPFRKNKPVSIYDYDGDNWVQVGQLEVSHSEKQYLYSLSLSSCGNKLAVGSVIINRAYCKGQASIYEYS